MIQRRALVFPVLLIILGTGWLLTARGFAPGVNWVWIAALGASGLLVMLAGGLDKITLFLGPFLILCSIASVLRQTGRLDVETQIPALTIVAGVLMLIVQLLPIPNPRWMIDDTPRRSDTPQASDARNPRRP